MIPNEIIAENKKRNALLDSYYNPVTGEGSLLDRFKLSVEPKVNYYLPVQMENLGYVKDIQKAGSVKKFVLAQIPMHIDINQELMDSALNVLNKLRYKYDFEYWAYVNITIKDKESGELIKFKLNSPQRKYIARLEKMRFAGVPIRIVLLKARQWGGSTLTQIYAFYLQVEHRVNWNSCIIGDVESQAANVRGMFTTAAKYYPRTSGVITLKPFEKQVKNIQIQETGAIISIGSAQKPDALRSADLKLAHYTECASWKETLGKKPKDLIQTISGTIHNIADTMIVVESTAKGVGNYFHDTWKRAETGLSGYDPVFVSWLEIEMYRAKFTSREQLNKFYDGMDDYEKFLWKSGATLEGIKWYRNKLNSDFGGDRWVMASEFPTTSLEAFQSTGHRVFPPAYVQNIRATCIDPLHKGYLTANAIKGIEALNMLAFVDNPNGDLYVWAKPDTEIVVKNRYLVSVDIGGKTSKADYSVIRVIDRYWLLDGGSPEMVATCKLHVDQDLLAWVAVQIAKWYNNALLAFESNSLRRYENTEGDGFLTVLNEIAEYYPNLYAKTDLSRINEGLPVIYGYHINMVTKSLVINTYKAAMRDGDYVERDVRAADEADTYEYKNDGSMGAVTGSHDDITMSTAICLQIALKEMESPRIIEVDKDDKKKRKLKSKIKSEATF